MCYSLELEQFVPPYFTLSVVSGRGFYVRSLVHDVGLSKYSLWWEVMQPKLSIQQSITIIIMVKNGELLWKEHKILTYRMSLNFSIKKKSYGHVKIYNHGLDSAGDD